MSGRAAEGATARRHSTTELVRLTQPDWCNAPRPGSWKDACMRSPGHDDEHAVRKSYRWDEAFYWPADGGYPVKYGAAERWPDLWPKDDAAWGPPSESREDESGVYMPWFSGCLGPVVDGAENTRS